MLHFGVSETHPTLIHCISLQLLIKKTILPQTALYDCVYMQVLQYN